MIKRFQAKGTGVAKEPEVNKGADIAKGTVSFSDNQDTKVILTSLWNLFSIRQDKRWKKKSPGKLETKRSGSFPDMDNLSEIG